MVVGLGGLVGILAGAIPEVFKFLKDRADKKHEIELFKLQMEYEKVKHTMKVEETELEAEVKELEGARYEYQPVLQSGFKVIDGISSLFTSVTNFANGIIRPMITTLVVLLYANHKYTTQNLLWTEFDAEVLLGVLGYWFTIRAMKYAMGR